jgi:hypothetical protein
VLELDKLFDLRSLIDSSAQEIMSFFQFRASALSISLSSGLLVECLGAQLSKHSSVLLQRMREMHVRIISKDADISFTDYLAKFEEYYYTSDLRQAVARKMEDCRLVTTSSMKAYEEWESRQLKYLQQVNLNYSSAIDGNSFFCPGKYIANSIVDESIRLSLAMLLSNRSMPNVAYEDLFSTVRNGVSLNAARLQVGSHKDRDKRREKDRQEDDYNERKGTPDTEPSYCKHCKETHLKTVEARNICKEKMAKLYRSPSADSKSPSAAVTKSVVTKPVGRNSNQFSSSTNLLDTQHMVKAARSQVVFEDEVVNEGYLSDSAPELPSSDCDCEDQSN